MMRLQRENCKFYLFQIKSGCNLENIWIWYEPDFEDFGFEHDTRGHPGSFFGMSSRFVTSVLIQALFISQSIYRMVSQTGRSQHTDCMIQSWKWWYILYKPYKSKGSKIDGHFAKSSFMFCHSVSLSLSTFIRWDLNLSWPSTLNHQN